MEILKHLNDEKPVNLQHSRFEKALQPSEAKIKEMKPRKGGPQNFLEFWEIVAGATIGDYLVNPRFLN